jgi:hypothetical protein
MYQVHEGIQKDQGLEGIKEPTGLGLNIVFQTLYLVLIILGLRHICHDVRVSGNIDTH